MWIVLGQDVGGGVDFGSREEEVVAVEVVSLAGGLETERGSVMVSG
jgi:hypothetical protein